MEGSRHERAATMLVSYGIGFVTAFILFASVTESILPEDTFVTASRLNNTAAVVNTVLSEVKKPVPEPARAGVSYLNGQLTVEVAGAEKLLSFNPKTSEISANLEDLPQGFHYGVLNYTVSSNGQYVFFCERQEENDPSCLGFVYDVSTDLISPVVKDSLAVTISETSAKNASWTGSLLTIGSYSSVSEAAPWVLVDENPVLDLQ